MSDTDLFNEDTDSERDDDAQPAARQPLAARMRPLTLEEVLGQDHILGPGKLLRRVIEADRLTNLIFYGPPGCGKTTLAEVIARATRRRFERTSGVLSNVAALRSICENAKRFREGPGTVLFVDEIHRFNKSQQDVLLPYVENGTVTLIGATTHNPNVFVNSPLTSRSLVFELRPLDEASVAALVRRALADETRGLGHLRTDMTPEAIHFLATICDGDARRALTALEVAVLSTPPEADGVVRITHAVMEESVQRKMVLYDKDEDGHYDTISAFIKSVRGSDPDAAVYWLAKMLEAGKTRASSRAASSFSPPRTSATPTRAASPSPSPPCRPWNSSACPKPASRWRRPPPTLPPPPKATPPTSPWTRPLKTCAQAA